MKDNKHLEYDRLVNLDINSLADKEGDFMVYLTHLGEEYYSSKQMFMQTISSYKWNKIFSACALIATIIGGVYTILTRSQNIDLETRIKSLELLQSHSIQSKCNATENTPIKIGIIQKNK